MLAGETNTFLEVVTMDVIADWLKNPDQVAFWIRGGAGLGKSTLAHKIVDSLRADDRLAILHFSHVVLPVISPQSFSQWQGN
jgi:adenylylsulfate kinase-like enzyme